MREMGAKMNEYRIAFSMESGEWDIIEEFEADDDSAANAYAEDHYPDDEWYVLDERGRNINGGACEDAEGLDN